MTQVSFPAGGRIDLDFELNGRVFLYYHMRKYSALHMRKASDTSFGSSFDRRRVN